MQGLTLSILIHTQTKNDLTLVYKGDCCFRWHFSGNLGFLFIRTVLEKWVVSFMHGAVGSGLLRLWFIRLCTELWKWFIEIEGYQVYARNIEFFCSLEKIEDNGLTVKT